MKITTTILGIFCRFILISLLIFVITLSSLAQEVDEYTSIHRNKTPMKFLGIKTEEKGNHDVYVITERKNSFLIYNKRNTLMHAYSTFMESPDGYKYINFDRDLLDSYVIKIIGPHFGGESLKYPDLESMSVSLFSDIDGNIKEIAITTPKEIKMPCSVIEKFEETVLNGKVKLLFDKRITDFKDASWVSITNWYNAEKLRKKGIQELKN